MDESISAGPPVKDALNSTKLVAEYGSRIENAYTKELEGGGEEGLMVSLSDAPKDKKLDRVRRMNDKFVNYGERLAEECAGSTGQNMEELNPGLRYKYAMARQMILDHKLVKEPMQRAFEQLDGGSFNQSEFDNAFGVIEDYVKTGGQNAMNSQGF